jgi:protein O-GlcNAc transferase
MTAVLLVALLPAQPGDPADAVGWKNRGVELAAANRLNEALPAFAKACALAPADEEACYYQARTLYSLDRWDEACEPFDKALRAARKVKAARVHRAMALNYIALGRPGDAEDHFRKAVQLNPGPEKLPDDPRVDYGAFLFRQGRIDEALPVLNEAVQASPQSARAHAELGKVLLHAGKVAPAARELELAVRLHPRSWAVRLLLGRAWLQLGRTEDGERELRIAREGWSRDQGSSTVR